MNHFLRSSLAALAAALIITVPADAAPRGVQSVVSVSAPTLTVQLAPGSRLKSVSGGKAKVRGRVVTIAVRAKTVRITTTGAAPKAFRAGAVKCAAKRMGARKLAIICAAPEWPVGNGDAVSNGGAPAGANSGGNAPGGSGGASTGGDAPGGTPGGDVPDGPGGEAPGGGTPAGEPYRFAPYIDFAGWPPPVLTEISEQSGAKHMTLGFVTADPDCAPAWGGHTTYPATGTAPYRKDQVVALRAQGGDIVVSFGGALGKELAYCTTDATVLANLYDAVIDAYDVTHVDFDIEGSAIEDTARHAVRTDAIKLLQARHPDLVVTLTVPTITTGLDQFGKPFLGGVVAAGVKLAAVNIMAMEFESLPNPAGKMGDYTILAGTALHSQLAAMYPTLTAAQRWRKVGITPMLGINYDTTQVFTPADAVQVTAWAMQKQIGMLAMWQLSTDSQCATDTGAPQLKCSGVTQTPFQFAKTFGTFAG